MKKSKRRYIIAIVESEAIPTISLSIDQIANPLENGADYEYRYALNELIDEILDLKLYEKMTFKWNRDNPGTIGIILRTL
jgi:hypothetical protein